MRICVISVVLEEQKYYIFWVCFCRLNYTACKANAPYNIVICGLSGFTTFFFHIVRGELSYLAPIGIDNISATNFKQCFFRRGGGITPQTNTTPPSPKTEITNILFYILNFASIIKFKM